MDKAATPFARRVKKLKFHMAHLAIKTYSLFPESFLVNAALFGQSLEFYLWTRRTFGKTAPFFATRERLWHNIIGKLLDKKRISVFEFGVAYGYATSWWLSHCPQVEHWYGFDTFTGLPQAWLHYEEGAFDAGGKPPAINDSRLQWYTGMVEDTFTPEKFQELIEQSGDCDCRIFLFDLDLYQPTSSAFNVILPQLRQDDILYFDEAADFDERRVIIEAQAMLRETSSLIGSTPVAMAFRRER